MTNKTDTPIDAPALSQELDDILAQLQSDDIHVDKALELYQKGIAITAQLDSYLKTAENKITKLNIDFAGK